MKTRSVKSIGWAIMFSFLVISCNTDTSKNKQTEKPAKKPATENQEIKDDKTSQTSEKQSSPEHKSIQPGEQAYTRLVEEQVFTSDAAQGISLKTNNGMDVKIPEGVLRDAEGNVVKGDVDIVIKEYYTPGEIMLSGMPMYYNDGDKSYPFESDGMFTLSASQNGQELSIAEGEHITAVTQRRKTGEGYEFYMMDGDQWVKDASQEIANTESVPTPSALDTQSPIEESSGIQRPEEPDVIEPLLKFNPNFYTIEKDERFSTPEMKKNKDIRYVTQLNIDVKENPWILERSKWQYDKHRNWIYQLESDKIVDTTDFEVRHAIAGDQQYAELKERNDRLNREYEEAMRKYNQKLTAWKQDNYSEGQMRQELMIERFGTYNIDRYYRQNSKLIVEKEYELKTEGSGAAGFKTFLVVKTQSGGIIPVDLSRYPDVIRFNKQEKNAILVMGEEQYYMLPAQRFNETVKAQIKQPRFNLPVEEQQFSDAVSFDDQLEQLF